MGARGTGKTTVLKAISYEGRHKMTGSGAADWPYIGLYQKVNSNRVTAFQGDELSPEIWDKAFSHYANLLLVNQVLVFLAWYRNNVDPAIRLPDDAVGDVVDALYLGEVHGEADLRNAVRRSFGSFERFLNNLNHDAMPPFSLRGQPLDLLCEHVLRIPQLHHRKITFIIDEFENLLDYQQIILNTLIKQSGEFYNFAIGVKELGWRQRYTSARTEALSHPADYFLIDIGEKLGGDNFSSFAGKVVELRRLRIDAVDRPESIEKTLPGLLIREEAKLLGLEDRAADILARTDLDEETRRELATLEPFERYFADFWSRNGHEIGSVLAERREKPAAWAERLHNYGVAMLFEFQQGRAGIAKYYAGWSVYLKLADGNIRFMLELIAQARQLHLQRGGKSTESISVQLQTQAAQVVGRKHLFDLEGLSAEGAKLMKLVLGLGRVFEVMAKKPLGRKPEITQFYLQENAPLGDLEGILREAIVHLALTRTTSNKLSGTDLKGYDYSLHPVFSPFFEYSWRRKRKMKLSPSQLLGLLSEPGRSIAQILRQKNVDSVDPLPEQLRLFEGFYGAPLR